MNNYNITWRYPENIKLYQLNLLDRLFYLEVLKSLDYQYQPKVELSIKHLENILYWTGTTQEFKSRCDSLLFNLALLNLRQNHNHTTLGLPVFKYENCSIKAEKITISLCTTIKPFFSGLIQATQKAEHLLEQKIKSSTLNFYQFLLKESVNIPTIIKQSLVIDTKGFREIMDLSSGYKSSDFGIKILKPTLSQFHELLGLVVKVTPIKASQRIIAYKITWSPQKILTAQSLINRTLKNRNKIFKASNISIETKKALKNLPLKFTLGEILLLHQLDNCFKLYPRRNYTFPSEILESALNLFQEKLTDPQMTNDFAQKVFMSNDTDKIFGWENHFQIFEAIIIGNSFINFRLTEDILKHYRMQSKKHTKTSIMK